MSYSISSLSYLDRARGRLGENTEEALVYAALEIRCGVEARLREYLEPQPHIPAKTKTDYRIKRLGAAAETVTPSEERLTRFAVYDEGRVLLTEVFFTPVSSRLKDLAGRCGDLFHAQTEIRDADWWDETRSWVEEAWEELRRANLGELLGTPLMHPEDRTADAHFTVTPAV